MEESLSPWLILFRPAGPAAALAAAPVYPSKQADVTLVMPVVKRARNSVQFNWPKMCAKSGEHAFPYVALTLLKPRFSRSTGRRRCTSELTAVCAYPGLLLIAYIVDSRRSSSRLHTCPVLAAGHFYLLLNVAPILFMASTAFHPSWASRSGTQWP